MTTPPPCAHCGRPAEVGIGEPVEWMCLDAYNERLADIGRQIRQLKVALGMTDGS